MVASIVIEQERITADPLHRAHHREFRPEPRPPRPRPEHRRRGAIGRGRRPRAARPRQPALRAAPQGPPASNWVDAVATYRSLNEWLELRRRLTGAAPVASVEVVGIAVDAARLRLGLRAPTQAAAGDLAALGIALAPVRGGAAAGETWRVGLAGGG